MNEHLEELAQAAAPASSSFHVVGGQFGTVFQEGAFPLEPDNAEQGAARDLDLAAAQSAFVELEFAEAGQLHVREPSFVNAERGAMAVIEVVD